MSAEAYGGEAAHLVFLGLLSQRARVDLIHESRARVAAVRQACRTVLSEMGWTLPNPHKYRHLHNPSIEAIIAMDDNGL